MKIFRDPVHDIIRFDKETDKLILDLIETKEMQRLRYIKQLGFSSITYPGAEHSRFSHSLGTAYLAKRIVARLAEQRGIQEKRWLKEITDNYYLLLCSALLHDIGHAPFSHAFENVTGIKHEKWTLQIINNPDTEVNQVLESHRKGFAKEVADVIARVHPCQTVVKLISSQLDVDRFDYLLRDSLMTGAGYGRFDLEWMLHTITIGEVDGVPEVGLDFDKGLSIAEDFVMARYYMYKHVYFHKTTRGVEIIARKILERVKGLLLDNEKIQCPDCLEELLKKPESASQSLYLELNDSILWYWFHVWTKSHDDYLRELCNRIVNRKLLKSADLSRFGPKELISIFWLMKEEGARLGGNYADYIEIDTPSTSSYSDPYLFKRSRADGEKEVKTVEGNNAYDNMEDAKEASEYIFLFDKQKNPHDLARASTIINAIREQKLEQQRLYFPVELHKYLCTILEKRR
ncbi:MAG: HD domain-containing protein [Firmicutes bacterium]|nr:HD domain-containing protein [Bacillota bacterium]